MNVVNFEGIGLSFNINRVLWDFGSVKIYWYGFLIVLAIVIILLLMKKDDGRYSIKFNDLLELTLFVIPISIICARIYYVVFRLDYYLNNGFEIFAIQDGGLAIYGGIIGAFITTFVFCKFKKINFLDVVDYVIVFLPLGQAIGRWGNFFNVEAYGYETTSLFRMGIFENGKYICVHPTFLYESICTLIIFIILFIIRNKRKFEGQIICLYFIMYGLVRGVIEGLRTDSLMISNIRVSQILSIILVIVFGSIYLYRMRKKND